MPTQRVIKIKPGGGISRIEFQTYIHYSTLRKVTSKMTRTKYEDSQTRMLNLRIKMSHKPCEIPKPKVAEREREREIFDTHQNG